MREESIGDALSRNLAQKGILNAAISANICAVAEGLSGGDFQAISFRDGGLKIRVRSSAKAYLIKMAEQEWIEKINTALKRQAVKKLIFKID